MHMCLAGWMQPSPALHGLKQACLACLPASPVDREKLEAAEAHHRHHRRRAGDESDPDFEVVRAAVPAVLLGSCAEMRLAAVLALNRWVAGHSCISAVSHSRCHPIGTGLEPAGACTLIAHSPPAAQPTLRRLPCLCSWSIGHGRRRAAPLRCPLRPPHWRVLQPLPGGSGMRQRGWRPA